MSRLSRIVKSARSTVRSIHSTSQDAPIKNVHARGAILGIRGIYEPKESALEQSSKLDEAILTHLLEEPRTDLLYPMKVLLKQMPATNMSELLETLHRMEKQGIIRIVKVSEQEAAVQLTLRGAVEAIYGDWFLDFHPRPTSTKIADRRENPPAMLAH